MLEFQFADQVISKLIYVRNLSSNSFVVSLILTDALFLLRLFSNSLMLFLGHFIMSYAILERGIFWTGTLAARIFS